MLLPVHTYQSQAQKKRETEHKATPIWTRGMDSLVLLPFFPLIISVWSLQGQQQALTYGKQTRASWLAAAAGWVRKPALRNAVLAADGEPVTQGAAFWNEELKNRRQLLAPKNVSAKHLRSTLKTSLTEGTYPNHFSLFPSRVFQ